MLEGDPIEYPIFEISSGPYMSKPEYFWSFSGITAVSADVQFVLEMYDRGRLVSTTNVGTSGSVKISEWGISYKLYAVASKDEHFENREEFEVLIHKKFYDYYGVFKGERKDNQYFYIDPDRMFTDQDDVQDLNNFENYYREWSHGLTGNDAFILPDNEKSIDEWGRKFNGGEGKDKLDASKSTYGFTLNGDEDGDTLLGGSGSDVIAGGSGSDLVNGGRGDDTIIGVSVKEKGSETNKITGGPLGNSEWGKNIDHDIIVYDGDKSDYKIKIDSYKSFFLRKPTLSISHGDKKDIIVGGVELIQFADRNVAFRDLQGAAGVKWAMEMVDDVVDGATKWAGKVGPVPQKVKSALFLMDAFREAVAYGFGNSVTKKTGADVFADLAVGLVKVVRNYVDTALPGSELLTSPYFDDFERQVRYDARETYYILTDKNTRPSVKEVAVAVKDMFAEYWGQYADMIVLKKEPDAIKFDAPKIDFGSDKADHIILGPAGATTPADAVKAAGQVVGGYHNVAYARGGSDVVAGSGFNDLIFGDAGNDRLSGNNGHDRLVGGSGNDRISGGAGKDALSGQSGSDILYGGSGSDRLSGGSGADLFVFRSTKESTAASAGRDTIYDFSRTQNDKIDLKAIDANTKIAGDQAFRFIGMEAFHKKAGELRFQKKNGDTFITGDVNGDGKTDFAVVLDLSLTMVKSDFIL